MRITVILTNEEHQELKRRAGAVPVSRWLRLLGLGGELPLTIENAIAVAKEIPATAEEPERLVKRQKNSKRTPPLINKPILTAASTCKHGKRADEVCWDCGGEPKVRKA